MPIYTDLLDVIIIMFGRKREKEVSAARTNLSDRRLSIAFRMMNLTKEDKQVGTSPGNFSNSPVTANEGHDEPFTPPNNRTVNYRQEWQKEKQTVTVSIVMLLGCRPVM